MCDNASDVKCFSSNFKQGLHSLEWNYFDSSHPQFDIKKK